jgi:hypothetical protein
MSYIKLCFGLRAIDEKSNLTWGKVKQSRYTPWRRLGGEEVQLLILYFGTRWG